MRKHHIALLATTFIAMDATATTVAVQHGAFASTIELQSIESVLVRDPRPLAAAVEQFEHRCHCVVTYEDPKWTRDDVEDISPLIRHTEGAPRPLIPRGRPFRFEIERELESASLAQLNASLGRIVTAFDESKNPGSFHIQATIHAFHAVPKQISILDTRITFTRADRTLQDITELVLSRVKVSRGETVGLATAPNNFVRQTVVSIEADNERADDLLSRSFSASGQKLSWQLLYDVGMARYYLNIHAVR